MRNLIKHLLFNHTDEILAKSYLDCHCKGLHSIMLLDSPEKTIRLYIAVKGNEMYKNFPANYSRKNMSVAFHPHHCNLTIDVIKGGILNLIVTPMENKTPNGFEVIPFIYRSGINESETRFEQDPSTLRFVETKKMEMLGTGDCSIMNASDVHTVACSEDELSAWLVYEGKEDVNYKSVAYSNHDLSKQNFSSLYKKMSRADLYMYLQLVGLMSH